MRRAREMFKHHTLKIVFRVNDEFRFRGHCCDHSQ